MYCIPKELDLSKAIGEFTTQICIGKYDFQFSLGKVHFTVESPITLLRGGDLVATWKEGTWPESGFIEIFNVPVTKALIASDEKIIIFFENSLEMHLVDNSDQFESMQISIEGEPETWII
ncbi:hypothetical protein M0G74_10835 [Microbulbifer sp. CAU 1566]|uniref:hypothetical protein n=1 Tax=Microbulbifer sp. CAU 1566 TaxID=2933269 RepID=UPI002005AAA2|nr:hypothetical protein [Microbulbifer sp. CAU 1566]MCK7597765.1 hypothetical protein [Microbulbifer sp. CAU 1566]